MRAAGLSTWILCGLLAVASGSRAGSDRRRETIQPDAKTGTSAAVVVADSALLHTTQLLPRIVAGQASRNVDEQIEDLLWQLDTICGAFGVAFGDLVKINLYARDALVVSTFQSHLARRFSESGGPALAAVVTDLESAPRSAAIDAVAVMPADDRGDTQVVRKNISALTGGPTLAHAAVLPCGDAVYVAGQAEKGGLKQATRQTLAGLRRTLDHLGLTVSDVVRVKCFMHPVTNAAKVRSHLQDWYGNEMAPPVSFVEWSSSLPIEIELVAWAPPTSSRETVSYVTPPWMTASPVYSRLARVHTGKRIYVSGLVSPGPADAEGQVREIFASLQNVLRAAGSDLRHLAKATYYVSTDDASRQLNRIRPEFYDPRRPPAASKAMVRGTGAAGATVSMDMIAVPTSGE